MKKQSIKEITIIAIYISLLTIFSWISIPLVIPFTLQTLMIFIIGYTLNLKKGLLVLISYIVLGILGLPVFSSFKSGITTFLGPTGGFLIGFFPQIIFISLFIDIKKQKAFIVIYKSIISLLICYIISALWFMLVYDTTISFLKAVSIVILPFIIPDILKMYIAYIVSKKIVL